MQFIDILLMKLSLCPDTFQAWSFLESWELPCNRLQVCFIHIVLKVYRKVSSLQNRLYKLPVGQAPSVGEA